MGQGRITTIAIITLALAAPAVAYDRHDAQFVTSSRNKAVLDYVVCLERHMPASPKDIAASLNRAQASCKSAAAKLPKSKAEPSAQDLRQMITECGFRPGDASPDMGC